MFSKKLNEKINNEALNFVIKENKRLKRENQRLRESLDNISHLKNEYKKLIEQVHGMKNEYANKLKEFDILKIEYMKKLDEITNK